MRKIPFVAAALAIYVGAANAQTATPAPDAAAAPVAGSASSGTPMPGANSFTETQARSRLESSGFTAITGLTKDSDGIWRAKATKDGRATDVALDFKGNIFAQ